jgi:SAM-dependent methyltransferase
MVARVDLEKRVETQGVTMNHEQLTDRQRREVEFHSAALEHLVEAGTSVPFNCLNPDESRWWSAYWQLFEYARVLDLTGKKCLIVGCGFGRDAIAFSKLGADTYAFDLSPEQLSIAKHLSERYGLPVRFDQMASENLLYPDRFFDLVVAVDILHHCEVRRSLAEILRVSKPGAIVLINELYTHSLLQRVRNTRLVEKCVYPFVARILYGRFRYVTADERKLNEHDLDVICSGVNVSRLDFFEMIVKRFVVNTPSIAKLETLVLAMSRALGRLFGGRFLLIGRIP